MEKLGQGSLIRKSVPYSLSYFIFYVFSSCKFSNLLALCAWAIVPSVHQAQPIYLTCSLQSSILQKHTKLLAIKTYKGEECWLKCRVIRNYTIEASKRNTLHRRAVNLTDKMCAHRSFFSVTCSHT